MTIAEFFKIKQSLASNYYACLSPPPCQVEEHENKPPPKPTGTFSPTIEVEPTVPTEITNRIAQRCARRLANRHAARQMRASTHENIANAYEPPTATRRYVIGNDDDALRRGIIDGTIPSTVADSGCTSGVGTSDDPASHFFCSTNTADPPNNGAILNISKILKAVMSSAAEAELGALYINAREAIPIRHLLEEMGHKQPPTPMQTDNSTAHGVVTNNIQPRRTKAIVVGTHKVNFAITGVQDPTT
jgi:hypothetical protein